MRTARFREFESLPLRQFLDAPVRTVVPITYQIGLCFERLGVTDRARAAYVAIVDGLKINPIPQFAELGRMAAWRMEHLDWHEGVSHQITSVFETSTGRVAPAPPPAAKPADGPPAPVKTAANP